MNGGGGTVGLVILISDGKADSIVYFGDYKDEGGSAVGMTIHNGYLYTSTVQQVLAHKACQTENLFRESKTEVLFTDDDTNVTRNWHTTKPVAFDDNGNMYIPFGGPIRCRSGYQVSARLACRVAKASIRHQTWKDTAASGNLMRIN